MPKNKNAIALLITITFLMAISAIIAFGLKNIQKDITNSTKESFYYQYDYLRRCKTNSFAKYF